MSRRNVQGVVYLIHFDTPFGHARHYCGWTENWAFRWAAHQAGEGSNLIRHVIRAGITIRAVRFWEGDRNLERRIKKQGGLGAKCPVCLAEGYRRVSKKRAAKIKSTKGG